MMRAKPRARPQIGPPVAALGECTRATGRCADARDYQVALRPCCRAHLRHVVAETVAALEAHGVSYWADYGTLLGAVRNPLTTWADYPWLAHDEGVNGAVNGPLAPGIIPHDKDADFGAFATDWPKLMHVRAALERQGFHVQVKPLWGSMKICLSAMNRTNLDIFLWQERPDGTFARRRYIGVDTYKGRDIPPGMLLPLGTVEWEGLTLSGPVNPEAFCAFRYGPNWRTPIAANNDGIRR
jgi:hypothetical protein